MRLGPIYDPSKFGWDISTNKKVYWFASSVVRGWVVVVGAINHYFLYYCLASSDFLTAAFIV